MCLPKHYVPGGGGSSKVIGSRLESGQRLIHLELLEPLNTINKYEHCILYKSKVTGKNNACGPT